MKFNKFSGVFSVFDNTTVTIIVKGNYNDYENTYDITEIGSVTGDLQRYSGELAEKEYGLQIECQKKFFCRPDTELESGMYLRADGHDYMITYVIPRDLGVTALLKEVNLRD